MSRPAVVFILAAATVAIAGCQSADEPQTENEPRVSYHEDIAPLLAERCVGCHTAGQIGPFVLETYEDAVEWGPLIQAAVQSRSMPPSNIVTDGSCGEFTRTDWLTDAEVEMISRWVDSEMPEGEIVGAPPVPPSLPALEGNVIAGELPHYVPVPDPEGPYEDYQCFLLQPAQGGYLTGYDVMPGNPATVHHVLAFKVDLGAPGNLERVEELDAETPDQPGWNCYGAGGEGLALSGLALAWAPGQGAQQFPPGVGLELGPDDALVVQMHYNLAVDDSADQSAIMLEFAEDVDRKLHMTLTDPFLFTLFAGEPATLQPGMREVSYTWSVDMRQALAFTFDPIGEFEEVEVFGIGPHMHNRGRKMSIDFEIGGQQVCGGRVENWDFDWQQSFIYREPLRLGPDDRMTVTCTWDTMGDAGEVMPGFGTDEEMCLVGMIAAKSR